MEKYGLHISIWSYECKYHRYDARILLHYYELICGWSEGLHSGKNLAPAMQLLNYSLFQA